MLTNEGTETVGVYKCDLGGRHILLIDTPGFDDSRLSDTAVLKEIASWLAMTYADRIKLHGIVYLHNITNPRMQGSALRNLNMFQKLCGDDALKRVILATTWWEQIDKDLGSRREQQLATKPDYWGLMVQRGSRMTRHENNRESGARILNMLLPHNGHATGVVLAVQTELVDQRKDLSETAAGLEVEKELAAEKQRLAQEMEERIAELEQESESNQKLLQDDIERLKKSMMAKDMESLAMRESIKTNFERQLSSQSAEARKREKELEDRLSAKHTAELDRRDKDHKSQLADQRAANEREQARYNDISKQMDKLSSEVIGAKTSVLAGSARYETRIRDLERRPVLPRVSPFLEGFDFGHPQERLGPISQPDRLIGPFVSSGPVQQASKVGGFKHLDSQPSFNSQLSFNSRPSFSNQPGFNSQPGLNSTSGFNNKPSFSTQRSFNSQRSFSSTSGFNSKPGFNSTPSTEPLLHASRTIPPPVATFHSPAGAYEPGTGQPSSIKLANIPSHLLEDWRCVSLPKPSMYRSCQCSQFG